MNTSDDETCSWIMICCVPYLGGAVVAADGIDASAAAAVADPRKGLLMIAVSRIHTYIHTYIHT